MEIAREPVQMASETQSATPIRAVLVELAGVAKTFRLGRTAAVRVNRLVSGSQ